ncbi:MAG: hypothetical protein FJ264_05660 [Planctomycetes bacterium]|nr:hypothetical protein [Planctomycetota bacterium]
MRGINHPRYDTYCMVAPILYGRLYFDLQKIGNAPLRSKAGALERAMILVSFGILQKFGNTPQGDSFVMLSGVEALKDESKTRFV